MKTAAALAFCALGYSFALGASAPALDGFINEPFWLERGRAWTLYDPAQPETITKCFLAYDDQYLYFAADVSDPNVLGANRTVKSKAWEDDAVKLLLHMGKAGADKWTAETFSYTFSATGGITWARGPLPENANPTIEPWPPAWDSAIKWASGLKPGTNPNVSGTVDAGYAIEARIPWTELGRRPPFKPGESIGVCVVNVCRPEVSLPNGRPISSVTSAREITPLNPSLWQRLPMDWYGPLATRGLVEPLPLWLGSPSPEYQVFQPAEADMTSRWWDRARWTARLERMRVQNMNTLVLRHTNPWTGLIAPATAATRPAADVQSSIGQVGWFKPEDFARCRDQFRWVLAEAKQRGISVYLLFADEPVGVNAVAASRPAETSAENCQALSTAARQLLDSYPDLAGIGAGEGFNSTAMVQALAEGTRTPASGSAPAASTPETMPSRRRLLVWADGAEVNSLVSICREHAGVQLLHSLQGSHWYKPFADTRIQEVATQVNQARGSGASPVPSIAVGSMRGALSYMFWFDPQWARTLMLDVRNQGIQGFLLDAGPGQHQLGREALFEYAYNAGQRFSPERWLSRLQVYGAGEYAGQLLEAMQHASAVMPESLLLLNEPSGRFMPQFGLLLAHYVDLPTYSSAWSDKGPADTRAQLLGSFQPAWPNPIWGRPVANVRSQVERTASSESVPANEIASNLASHVNACKSLMPALRHLKPADPDQAAALNVLLDNIELNIAIGDHMNQKILAAVAFVQYQQRRGRSVDCLQPLQKSVEAWAKVAEISDRLFPEPVEYWQSQPVSVLPWSAEYIRETYVPVTGRWRDQVRRFDREYNLIREVLSGGGAPRNLPLWDHVNAYPEEKRQTRFVIDFEQPDGRYRIENGAALEQNAKNVLAGKRSLLVDTRSLPAGRHEVFVTDPGQVPLMSAQKYEISLLYRVLDGGKGNQPFEIGVRPAVGGESIGDHRTWTAPAGHTSARILEVPRPAQDGNVFYIATTSPAAIVIDAISIAQIIE